MEISPSVRKYLFFLLFSSTPFGPLHWITLIKPDCSVHNVERVRLQKGNATDGEKVGSAYTNGKCFEGD